LQYCAMHNLPADFVSTHYYPTDAFGEIGADTITQLEHAPLDVMRAHALSAREQAAGKPLLYTEWNITSNPRDPLHDSAEAAALAVRIVMGVDGVADAYSYWTFSDIFEENYFPSVPFHGGFGLMNLHGIKKPIYHAFAMVARLGARHFPVAQSHPTLMLWAGEPDAEGASHVLVINQAMPRHAIAGEGVQLRLQGPAGRQARLASIARIDGQHANPAGLWRNWGSPDYLSASQVTALQWAGTPVPEALELRRDDALALLDFTVAPQSANLLRIEWEAQT
jgi:xylan 1,4-beta-xylosidase